MTKKHTKRHKEARAEKAAPKLNGAAHHDPSYFTGAPAQDTTQADERKPAQGGTEKLFTGEELRQIVRYAYNLGYTLGQRTGRRCQAEHDIPVIRNQRDRLQRAGDKVGRLKAALVLSNTALAQSTAALVD